MNTFETRDSNTGEVRLNQSVKDTAKYLASKGVRSEITRWQEDRVSVYENPEWQERYLVEFQGTEDEIVPAFSELNAELSRLVHQGRNR